LCYQLPEIALLAFNWLFFMGQVSYTVQLILGAWERILLCIQR